MLALPEGKDLGQALNDAMAAVERENDDLRGVLPRTYKALSNATLTTLLRNVNAILGDIDGDGFGKVYEYFLGKFAMAEGQKGGQFFTPTSIVRLIVEIIEPFSGKILDPACGSGGMFVQSALRRGAPQGRDRPAVDLRPGARRRDREAVSHEPRGPRPRWAGASANTYYEDPFDQGCQPGVAVTTASTVCSLLRCAESTQFAAQPDEFLDRASGAEMRVKTSAPVPIPSRSWSRALTFGTHRRACS